MSEEAPSNASIEEPEVLYERLFQSSPDAVILCDSQGRILRLNSQMERLFGYSQSDLVGQAVEILIPERFRGIHPQHRNTYAASPRLRSMGAGLSLFGRRKDGTEFPVDIMLNTLETRTGPLTASVIRDITRLKEEEQARHLIELRFQLLVENARDYAIFLMDSSGHVVTWNSGAERLKGYTASEIIGRSFSCFYPPEEAARGVPEDSLRVAAATGRFESEGWRIRKDGTRFWADVVITSIRDGGELTGFAKVTRDFTERKKAADALERSEQQLQSFFEFSPDALVVADSEGRIIRTNAQTERLFGYTREELSGQPVEMLMPERFRGSHPHHRTRYGTESRVRPMGIGLELLARRKDGAEFPVDIMLGPVSSVEGDLVISVIRDLSEKKRAEEAFRRSQLQKQYLEEELNTDYKFEEIIGESLGIKRVLKAIETVAATDVTVLIQGETGTGKDLVARAIHQLSSRHEHSTIKLNCAAIPTGLLESELFGHEKGAFTGAISQKVGRLELAHEGTLFLDEVGDLPLEIQPKLLRALQEKEFERLGGVRTIPVNIRLIAATNRDLKKMVADKEFRSDLFYRLSVFPILVPPLRERREDIPLLVRYFVDKHARRMNKQIESIPSDVMEALVRWSWPGNIRELENFIERAVILSKGPALRPPLSELETGEVITPEGNSTLESAEREHILRVLRETRGLIGGTDGAAKRLGLKRTTLNSKLKKLGIERQDYI